MEMLFWTAKCADGQNEQAVETEQPDEEDYINENARRQKKCSWRKMFRQVTKMFMTKILMRKMFTVRKIFTGRNDQVGENGQAEEHKQPEEEGRGTSDGQNPESSQQASDVRYFLTAYISEYFQVDETGLKYDMQAESVKIQNQKGQETEITKLTAKYRLKMHKQIHSVLKYGFTEGGISDFSCFGILSGVPG